MKKGLRDGLNQGLMIDNINQSRLDRIEMMIGKQK